MTSRYFLLSLLFFTFNFSLGNLQAQCETGIHITSTDGANRVYTCPGDGMDDIIQFAHTGNPENFTYVITDDNNMILGIPPSNEQNFEGAGVGTCRVWGFSYTGDVVANTGDHVFSTGFSTGCWAISNTFLEVRRDTPDGGTVAMPSGETSKTVCTSDGYDDPIQFRHQTASNAAYRYVITDDQNNILGLPPGDNLNFEGVPAGTCRVWGLSYTGSVLAMMGDNAANATLSDGCFDLSDNFIEVIRTDVHGGTVATTAGEISVNTCTQDGTADVVTFSHDNNSASNYAYIITDNNDYVLGLPPANMQDFDGAPAGTCRVWGISYTGDLKVYAGDLITDKALSTDCFDLSDNFIAVVRENCGDTACDLPTPSITIDGDIINNRTVVANRAAGTISVINGDQGSLMGTYAMPDNGEPMYVVHNSSNNTILVGDYTGKVVAFDGADFSVVGSATAGDGVFHMWLSADNQQLWVNNELAKTISVINPNTMETLTTFDMPSDLVADFKPHDVIVDPDNASAYVTFLGDNAINYVVKYNTATFEEMARAEVGEDPHVSLTANNTYIYVAAQGADIVHVLNRSDLSTVVDVDVPNAHGLGMNAAGTHLYISNISDGGENAIYTLDLASNTLLDAVDTPYGVPHNFTVGNNDSKLYITHSGGSSDKVTIFDLSPNPTFSNEITVEANPFGLVSYYYASETEINICAGDGQSNAFEVAVTEGTSSDAWIITDTEGNILGLPAGPPFDLEGAGAGTCLVWYANVGDDFEGAAIGNNAFEDLTGCYALSNAITVYRESMDAGEVMMPSGATMRYTCANDGVDDMVMFTTTSAANNYNYVITDTDYNILGVPPSDSQNFEGAGVGVCLVWGLAYNGTLTAQAGDNLMDGALADGCYALSSNYITINRDEPNGGTVATIDGETSVSVTVGDGDTDVISFMHEDNSNSNYAYIVTDDQNNILGLPASNSQDFEGAPAGVCRVWGLAYTGTITAEMGDNIDETALTNECYNLSANFIEVVRNNSLTENNPQAFQVSTPNNLIHKTQLAPNPAQSNVTISFELEATPTTDLTIEILNLSGQLVLQQSRQAAKGFNQNQVDISGLDNGIYFVRISAQQVILNQKKLVKID